MKALTNFAAAVAVAGSLVGGAAMAQTVEVTPETTFTTQEVDRLTSFFNLQSCSESALMNVQLGMMMGQFADEATAQAAFEAGILDCETTVGMTGAEAEALVGDLTTKYGGENLNMILENSVPMFPQQP